MNRLKKRQSRARAGEILAAFFLIFHGYKIIARNWTTHWGELDIVAIRGRTLIIVEVKTRYIANELGDPLDHVKQKALERTAYEFQQHYRRKLRGYRINKVRFDLLVVRHYGGIFKYNVTEYLQNQF